MTGVEGVASSDAAPALADVQATNWGRYLAALRAGRLRALDDPDREAKLARLRAEMVAGNEGGVTRWPDGGSDA